MDNCKDNVEAISMLVDGELGDAEAQALRAHIARCDTCKKIYDAFSAISDSIGDELVQPPKQLAKGVMFRVNLMNERKRRPRFAYGRFTAIAACFVAILLGANYFGLLGGSMPKSAADKSAEAASSEVLEESAAADMNAPESGNQKNSLQLDKFFLSGDILSPADGAEPTAQFTGAEKNGEVAQFGLGARPIEADSGSELPGEKSFQTYLEELIAYADENPPESTDEDYAFFREDEAEERAPVTIRIYEGEYEKPEERASASNLFTANVKNEEEQQPKAEFADLSNLRFLDTLFKGAEVTDKTFDTQPSYTIGVFDLDGKLMDEKVLPLRLWVHGGHIYFEADAQGTMLRATVKPDELTKLIEALENKEK